MAVGALSVNLLYSDSVALQSISNQSDNASGYPTRALDLPELRAISVYNSPKLSKAAHGELIYLTISMHSRKN